MEHHDRHEPMPTPTLDRQKLVLRLQNFLPPDCACLVEDCLRDVPGVESVQLNTLTGELHLELVPGTPQETIVKRLKDCGFEGARRQSTAQMAHAEHAAHAAGEAPEHDHHAMMERDMKRRFFVVLVVTIPVLILSPTIQAWLGFSLPTFGGADLLLFALATVIVAYGGWPFYKGAIKALRNGKSNMDVLVSVAVLTGYLYSVGATFLFVAPDFYWEISTLVLFLLFGHWMEMRTTRVEQGGYRLLAAARYPPLPRCRPVSPDWQLGV